MQDEYRIIKLSFHIHIKTHSEWHCANFGQGKYSKTVSLFDFQELQLKNVINYCFIMLNTYSLHVHVFLGAK